MPLNTMLLAISTACLTGMRFAIIKSALGRDEIGKKAPESKSVTKLTKSGMKRK